MSLHLYCVPVVYIFECLHLICLVIEKKNNLLNQYVLLVQTPAYVGTLFAVMTLQFFYWWYAHLWSNNKISFDLIDHINRGSFFPFKLLSQTTFFPTVILLLMLHSTTCNLVWTETASQSEVWSVVFISYAVTHFLEVLHRPIRSVVKKQNFLRVEKWEISTFPRESPTTALGAVRVAFTVMNRQRKNCNFFELFFR